MLYSIIRTLNIILFVFFISGCDYSGFRQDKKYSFIKANNFKVDITPVPDSFFVVWPNNMDTMPDSQIKKFDKVYEILEIADDVSVVISPVYNKADISKAELQKRCLYIQKLLLASGVKLNKIIFIKGVIVPSKPSYGFKIDIEYLSLKVPNCDEFNNTTSDKADEDSLENFGCATTSNFGKMIAFPSSLRDSIPTSVDTDQAMQAINDN